jgi:Zn-dependent protease with chaperone function
MRANISGPALARPTLMAVRLFTTRYSALIPALVLTLSLSDASAQTVITPDKNKYSPAEDVKIGQEAAQQARRELPMLNDSVVDNYVDRIGRRLVNALPEKFQHREFRYSFDVVNQKEINAFALPGGPMFLNRGMIEAAQSEAEMAGVMAHELSHVALRHGTAQATKAQPFQIGALAGQILGAIVGGTAGNVISAGSQFGLGTYFLKYGREYEREADLLGAQIMARAGYNPRQMADMFRTIEKESGGGGPEWLSSHPNPGNRYDAINREAESLQVQGNAEDTAAFNSLKARLEDKPPAYTAEQIARGQAGRGGGAQTVGRRVGNVERPSSRYRTVPVGNFLRVAVPSNWQALETGNATVVLAPEGGYYRAGGNRTSFTHGLEFGVVPNDEQNFRQTTSALVDGFRRSNPNMRMQGDYRSDRIGGRNAITAQFSNRAEGGHDEIVTLSTVPLRDGNVLYMVGVAPADEFSAYQRAFDRARQTVEINDRASR